MDEDHDAPKKETEKTKAKFEFVGFYCVTGQVDDQDNYEFEWKLDHRGDSRAASHRSKYGGLDKGKHKFKVFAHFQNSDGDPTPANKWKIVDWVTRPAQTILDVAAGTRRPRLPRRRRSRRGRGGRAADFAARQIASRSARRNGAARGAGRVDVRGPSIRRELDARAATTPAPRRRGDAVRRWSTWWPGTRGTPSAAQPGLRDGASWWRRCCSGCGCLWTLAFAVATRRPRRADGGSAAGRAFEYPPRWALQLAAMPRARLRAVTVRAPRSAPGVRDARRARGGQRGRASSSRRCSSSRVLAWPRRAIGRRSAEIAALTFGLAVAPPPTIAGSTPSRNRQRPTAAARRLAPLAAAIGSRHCGGVQRAETVAGLGSSARRSRDGARARGPGRA